MTSTLHLRIRQAREDAGLKREPMAVKLGISVSTLRNYETGRTQRISYQTLAAIARETGKPLSFFVEEVAAA
jgi:transcriptional regulator with XRE-family HTH domain